MSASGNVRGHLLDFHAYFLKRLLHEFTDRVRLARSQHKVLRRRLLQHTPHALHVVLRVTPISPRINVTQVQTMLLSKADLRRRTGNFARDKRPSTAWALVVEEDTIARVHTVRLPVVHCDPVRVQLRAAIRRARVERRRLGLRGLDDLAVQLGCRGLVETYMLLKSTSPDRVEQAKRSETIDVPCIFGHLKRDLDV